MNNYLSGFTKSLQSIRNYTESVQNAVKIVKAINIDFKPITEMLVKACENLTFPGNYFTGLTLEDKISYMPPLRNYTHELQVEHIRVDKQILEELKAQKTKEPVVTIHPITKYPGKRTMLKEVIRMTKQCSLAPSESKLLKELSDFVPHKIRKLPGLTGVKDVKHAKETLNKKLGRNKETFSVVGDHGGGYHDSMYVLKYSPTSETPDKN